jgi:HSP20 family protein
MNRSSGLDIACERPIEATREKRLKQEVKVVLLFDPFAPFDELLGRPVAGPAAFVPYADVTVSESDMVLTFDLPGVAPDDVQVEVLDGSLVIRGERRRPDIRDGSTWTHSERAFGRFERRIRLPEGVDADAITASFEHGVLSLIVPKPERMKPKTIAVGGGAQRRELTSA